jgi:hypothetical protein
VPSFELSGIRTINKHLEMLVYVPVRELEDSLLQTQDDLDDKTASAEEMCEELNNIQVLIAQYSLLSTHCSLPY